MSNSKTYRIKGGLVNKIKEKQISYNIDNKESIDESDITNALILKGLENIKDEDIEKYKRLKQEGKIK